MPDPDIDVTVDASAAAPPSKLERADVVLGVLLIVVGIYSLVLLPFSPSQLGRHTILWEALRGSTASILIGGALVHVGSASIFTVVLASLVGTIRFDWLYWWGGARWGQWWINILVQDKPRTARVMARIQGLMARWGTPIVLVSRVPPVPALLVFVAAGWSGMTLRRFLVLDIIAALLRIGLLVSLGYAIGHPVIQVAKEISHYGLALGVAIVVIVTGRLAWRKRRDR